MLLMLLSYMRFLATSVKLLKFTIVYSKEDYAAFYYDANMNYFGWPHAAYGVLAILCLLLFVVTPTSDLKLLHLMLDGSERRYFVHHLYNYRVYIAVYGLSVFVCYPSQLVISSTHLMQGLHNC